MLICPAIASRKSETPCGWGRTRVWRRGPLGTAPLPAVASGCLAARRHLAPGRPRPEPAFPGFCKQPTFRGRLLHRRESFAQHPWLSLRTVLQSPLRPWPQSPLRLIQPLSPPRGEDHGQHHLHAKLRASPPPPAQACRCSSPGLPKPLLGCVSSEKSFREVRKGADPGNLFD